MLFVAVVFIAICVWLPVRWTKRFDIREANDKAAVEDSYRKTVAQILGGAAIALAFAWTWIKDRETIEQSRIQTANQQFGTAATLISKGGLDARSAGIYSMENLVGARPQYYKPVVNTLESMVKMQKPESVPDGARPLPVSADIQAAIYVLGRMPQQESPLDMQHTYLVGGDFRGLTGFRGANFKGAVLFATNFSGANLSDTHFDGAQMSDWESFGRADWSDQVIQDWKTSKAWERVRFVALFDWATLTNATFEGMSVSGASFENADLAGTSFIKTDLSRADFKNARNLDQAKFLDNCYSGPEARPLGVPAEILKAQRSSC
jgi:uncharacterized protein YjbI with pentapeptide repeats